MIYRGVILSEGPLVDRIDAFIYQSRRKHSEPRQLEQSGVSGLFDEEMVVTHVTTSGEVLTAPLDELIGDIVYCKSIVRDRPISVIASQK